MEANTVTGFAKPSITATSEGSISRNASSIISKSSLNLEKRELIQEMQLRAKEIKRQLKETEKRQACVDRIVALEKQLSELHNEKIKRLKHIGVVDNVQKLIDPILHTRNQKSTSSFSSQANTEKETEIDQIKRFCRQFKSGEKFVTTSSADCFESSSCNHPNPITERIRGGAGCGACGIAGLRRNLKLYPNLPSARNNIGRITKGKNVRKFQMYQRGQRNRSQNRNDGGETLAPAPKTLLTTCLDLSELQTVANELVMEIDRVRRENARNRQKIIELCVVLKQKEAAINECTELLCHIMNDKDDITNVIAEVQGGQLAKHVEYLRWILIRLQFENMSQKSEIEVLCNENIEKDNTLKSCKEQKERVCAEKVEKENNLLQFTMAGTCDLQLLSADPCKKQTQNVNIVTC